MRLLAFFFILFSSLLSFAQNSDEEKFISEEIKRGDSLYETKNYLDASVVYANLISVAANKSPGKANLYKKLGNCYLRLKKNTLAENYYRKSLSIDSISQVGADNYYNICLLKLRQNKKDSAYFYLEKSLQIFDATEATPSAYNTYLSAGILYKNVQQFERSLDYLLKAYQGFKEHQNYQKLGRTLNVMGSIQNEIKNYYSAIKYLNEALEVTYRVNDPSDIAKCHNNIAISYKNIKQLDSAVFHYAKAVRFLKKEDKTYSIALRNLANIYQQQDLFDLAKENYETSLRLDKQRRDTTSMLYSYNGLGNFYLQQKNAALAKRYIDSAHSILGSTSNKLVKLDFLQNEMAYARSNNNFEKAFQKQASYVELFEEVYNIEQTNTVQNLQHRFDYQKQQNEILSLKLQDKEAQILLQQKEQKINKKNNFLLILGASILLVSLGLYFVWQRLRFERKVNEIETLKAIQEGQEDIKNRIARDLHDIITSNFDGIRLRIQALKDTKNPKELMDEVSQNLLEVNKQIRLTSHRLSPLGMQIIDNPFSKIIKDHLTEFQLYNRIFVEFENPKPQLLDDLPYESKNNVYGIILEILHNVSKHASATKLEVSVNRTKDNELLMSFQDNGIGILKDVKKGIGLMNIQQRSTLLGGTFSIENNELGTLAHLKFPLQ